ncbi:MAG TPA: hypothetical protein VGH24_12600 [Solirubrobacteraceae bacterium]
MLTASPKPPGSRPSAAQEDGFTIVELLFALVVMVIGILGLFIGFVSAQKLSLVSENQTSMTQVAQREIERIESTAYSQIGLSSTPGTSTDANNPDYYVTTGSSPAFEWDRTAGSSESLDIDTSTPGVVAPVQSWSEGRLSGQIYDFVTWTSDPRCSPGCPATQDYKRITVAVTVSNSSHPQPVWLSSVIADPKATPAGGTSNGTSGNPLTDPNTTCSNGSGQTVSCTSPIDSGNPNTYYLHDWAATAGSPQTPSSDNATHPTVGVLTSLVCTTSTSQASNPANITGCPVPDLMDANIPAGTGATPLYHYSTDQAADSAYPGGRVLQPTCSAGLCSGNQGGGTGATSDCNGGNWSSSLLKVQSQFYVTSPLAAGLSLTGDGGISLYTQTHGAADAVVSFCIEVYDVPPSGSAGSLKDILAWPPVALGGAAYVPATDPNTGSNWPTSVSPVSYIFNFRGSNGVVSVAAGHRIGVRIWMKANVNSGVDLLYDNPSYPSEIQLNSQ